MKLIQTATNLFLMMMVMSPYQSIQAQKCSDVCPNEDRSGCWVANVFWESCNSGNSLKKGGGQCNAWCWCNSFGRKCYPCGSCNRGLVDVTTFQVDDYSEYMAYSDNDKMVELSDTVCPEGKVAASYELHRALESLADTNGDGFLSRDEFENAHHDTSDILDQHCVNINDVEHESEEDVVTKALSFISRNQDTYEEEDPMVNFVARAKKEGERCKFPFPNCGSGLYCAERRNKNPVCHRRGKCYPSGFRAPSSGVLGESRPSYRFCCSKTGSRGWCR